MFDEYNQQEAIGDAYEEGRKEGLRGVASSLLAEGVPAERVAGLTGLSVSEVQALSTG